LIVVFGIAGVLTRAQRNEDVENDREVSTGLRKVALNKRRDLVVWMFMLLKYL